MFGSARRTGGSDGLVDRAGRVDQQAFTELIRAHDDKMRGLAYQLLGSRSGMDDALQDAYLKAYRALPRFRGDSSFATWLYRIVYTTCVDHLRRSNRRKEVGLQAVPDIAASDDAVESVGVRDAVANALATLSEDHRTTLVLIDREGLSYDEVAHVMETTPGTVASRLFRARAAFKGAMHNEGTAQ